MKTIKLLFFAIKNIPRNRNRNILTGFSIAMGTIAIIVGIAITDGIVRQTIIGFTGTLVEDVMIFPAEGEILSNYTNIEKTLAAIDGVDYITKKIQFMGAVFSDVSSLNSIVMGMEPEGIRRKTNLKIEKGRYLEETDSSSLLISEKLAKRLRVSVGDKVAIVVNTPAGGTNALDLQVVGIFSVKTGLQFVDHLIYIGLRDTQRLMTINDDSVFSLGVYLNNVDRVDHFEKKIIDTLSANNYRLKVGSWKKVMAGILAQYLFIKKIVLLFTSIMLLIVTVGVMNALFISMGERIREIGVLMAMGAKKRTIAMLLFAEGATLSFFSVLAGSIIGVLFCLLLEKLEIQATSKAAVWVFGGKTLLPYIQFSTVLFAFCFVFIITVVGILYPIIKVSHTEPVEAMRHV